MIQKASLFVFLLQLCLPINNGRASDGVQSAPETRGTSSRRAKQANSTLNFLKRLRALVHHGDLTDVRFTEKTLQMRFERDPREIPLSYKAISTPASILGVRVFRYVDGTKGEGTGGHSFMALSIDENRVCIDAKQLREVFGGTLRKSQRSKNSHYEHDNEDEYLYEIEKPTQLSSVFLLRLRCLNRIILNQPPTVEKQRR